MTKEGTMGKKGIELGSRVRDTYTGLEGTAVGRTEWMYGCNRIAIEPTELHEGKLIAMQWVDEQRVEPVKVVPVHVSRLSRATAGGPHADPSR